MTFQVTVNGRRRTVTAGGAANLLDVLRDDLHLPGTKGACEEGECGSCTVWLDGEVVCACLVLAVQAADRDVVTIEGIGGDGRHPVQEELIRTGGIQCGFCTPGIVMAAADLLHRVAEPDEDVIREALAGNLCRCTGYTKILDAVKAAGRRMRGQGADA
jgi:carbon-monoxide dehydrogenase small subunit